MMMSKIDQLKTIQNMPLTAAYWMGRRDASAKTLKETLSWCTVDDLHSCQAYAEILEAEYAELDKHNDNFAHEMGWI